VKTNDAIKPYNEGDEADEYRHIFEEANRWDISLKRDRDEDAHYVSNETQERFIGFSQCWQHTQKEIEELKKLIVEARLWIEKEYVPDIDIDSGQHSDWLEKTKNIKGELE
jgi:hypothetical protein